MQTQNLPANYYLKSAGIILLSCLFLFSLDHETKQFSDLLKTGNLVALVIYFIPVYLICFLLFSIFQRAKSRHSTTLALTIGIPLGFLAVIIALSFAMGRI